MESDQKVILINFLPNKTTVNIHYHTKIFNLLVSSWHMKIDVCPGDDLQTFYPSEADGLN